MATVSMVLKATDGLVTSALFVGQERKLFSIAGLARAGLRVEQDKDVLQMEFDGDSQHIAGLKGLWHLAKYAQAIINAGHKVQILTNSRHLANWMNGLWKAKKAETKYLVDCTLPLAQGKIVVTHLPRERIEKGL
jgi:hypothetical protein